MTIRPSGQSFGLLVFEPVPRVALTGTLDEVNRYFYEQGWTDGLPSYRQPQRSRQRGGFVSASA